MSHIDVISILVYCVLTAACAGTEPRGGPLSSTSDPLSGYKDQACTDEQPADAESSMGKATPGPLRILPSNPRWLDDGTGKGVYFAGISGNAPAWWSIHDIEVGNPRPAAYDYASAFAGLKGDGLNFLRMWSLEQPVSGDTFSTLQYSPIDQFPFRLVGTRIDTSTGGDVTVGIYDLSQYNQTYFDRVRTRVLEANRHGLCTSFMLFSGGHLTYSAHSGFSHPYYGANNINAIDADTNGNDLVEETHTLSDPRITAYQVAYVKKMIDTLNDIDCLVWEISNEDRYDTTAWQSYMAQEIKAYEAYDGRKPHPVWISYYNQNIGVTPANNDYLFNNPYADIVSPGLEGGAQYDTDPPVTPAAGSIATEVVKDTFSRPDSVDLGASWVPLSGVSPLRIVHRQIRASAYAGGEHYRNSSGIAGERIDVGVEEVGCAGVDQVHRFASGTKYEPSQLTERHQDPGEYGGCQMVDQRTALLAESREVYSKVLSSNQYAQATLATLAEHVGQRAMVIVRGNPATGSGYEGFIDSAGHVGIAKYAHGASTTLAVVPYAAAANDVIRLEALEAELKLYVNGVCKVSAADSSYASGMAGVGISVISGGTVRDMALDDWSAGTLSHGGRMKVVFNDTDHYIGVGMVDEQWPWKNFLRGLYPIFLSEREPLDVQAAVKAAQRQTILYAKKIHLGMLRPASDTTVCSTGYCLFSAGNEYVMYSSSGSPATIDMRSVPDDRSFTVEYFNPATDAAVTAAAISGGAIRLFSPPSWSGAWVVYVKRTGRGT